MTLDPRRRASGPRSLTTTSRAFLAIVACRGWLAFSPLGGAALTEAQRDQAHMSAIVLAAGQMAKAEVLRPTGATPADAAAWLEQRGRWLLRDEKWADAEKDFFAASKLAPDSLPAQVGLIEAALRLDRTEAVKNRLATVNASLRDSHPAVRTRNAEEPAAGFMGGPHEGNLYYRGTEPGLPHLFLLDAQINYSGVDEAFIEEFGANLGEALPEALLLAGETEADDYDPLGGHASYTRAIAEAGGRYPAAERAREKLDAIVAQANALEPGHPDIARHRNIAENKFAARRIKQAFAAATEAISTGRELPSFAARQLLYARIATRVALEDGAKLGTSNAVKAARAAAHKYAREAARIFASVPHANDAAATDAAAELFSEVAQRDPGWPMSLLPVPFEIPAQSPRGELLPSGPWSPGDPRLAILEQMWTEAWGQGPSVADLATAAGRERWSAIGRLGALAAHLRWFTRPEDSSEAKAARTETIQRITLALLCRPEATAAFRGLKQHAWAEYFDGRKLLAGKPNRFVTTFAEVLTGDPKKGRQGPPENPEELSDLLSYVLPLAVARPDLPVTQPGIAAAMAAHVGSVMGRVRFKDRADLKFAGEALVEFTWAWTGDPARTLDVFDWVNAQLETDAAPGGLPIYNGLTNLPAAVAATPLGHFVETLDAWLAAGAPQKHVPAPLPEWAAAPSVVWRLEEASWRRGARIDLAAVTARAAQAPEWSLSLAPTAWAGRVMRDLDRRFGPNRLTEKMTAETAAAWLKEFATYEAVLLANKTSLSAEARERLTPHLQLHLAQVQLAGGDLAGARNTAPKIAYALENGKNWNGHDPIAYREETGANLVEILPGKPRPAYEGYQRPEPPKPVVSTMKICDKCGGSGRIYFNTTRTRDVRAKETDGYGQHEIIGTETSRGTDSMMCSRCLGAGEIKR